jgi:hypothetical protein
MWIDPTDSERDEIQAIAALITAAYRPLLEPPDFPVEGFTVYDDILDAEFID